MSLKNQIKFPKYLTPHNIGSFSPLLSLRLRESFDGMIIGHITELDKSRLKFDIKHQSNTFSFLIDGSSISDRLYYKVYLLDQFKNMRLIYECKLFDFNFDECLCTLDEVEYENIIRAITNIFEKN